MKTPTDKEIEEMATHYGNIVCSIDTTFEDGFYTGVKWIIGKIETESKWSELVNQKDQELESAYGEWWESEMNKWFTRDDLVNFFELPNHGTKTELIDRIRQTQISKIKSRRPK